MASKNKQIIQLNKAIERNTAIDLKLADKFKRASKRKITFQDFVDEFINQFISEQTKKAYIGDLFRFFEFLASGNVHINHPTDIEGHHFQFYRDDLIEKGYTSATINRKLVAIRSFMKWCLACKLIEYNPLDIVKLPKVETTTPTKAFTDVEVVAMINTADNKTAKGAMHRFVMVMLFSLGLRRSELTHIKIKDIYTDRGHWVLQIFGKGGKIRHLPLNPTLITEYENYLSVLAESNYYLEDNDFLIQTIAKNKNTKPIDGSTIYRIIEKYSKLCDLKKKVSPHSCRATAISHLLDTQKTPIRDVAIFAGHSKITTTERYDKRREGLDDSAAYKVNYTKTKKPA